MSGLIVDKIDPPAEFAEFYSTRHNCVKYYKLAEQARRWDSGRLRIENIKEGCFAFSCIAGAAVVGSGIAFAVTLSIGAGIASLVMLVATAVLFGAGLYYRKKEKEIVKNVYNNRLAIVTLCMEKVPPELVEDFEKIKRKGLEIFYQRNDNAIYTSVNPLDHELCFLLGLLKSNTVEQTNNALKFFLKNVTNFTVDQVELLPRWATDYIDLDKPEVYNIINWFNLNNENRQQLISLLNKVDRVEAMAFLEKPKAAAATYYQSFFNDGTVGKYMFFE